MRPVLHLVKTTNGAAWAVRQARELIRLGVGVTTALPSDREGSAAVYREIGAHVVAANLDFSPQNPLSLHRALSRCRAVVSAVRPVLIHSHFVSTTVVARMALGRGHEVPRIFQVPGPLHLEHRPFRALDLFTSGPRDWWVASCRWTRDEYLRCGVPPERVFLSYYGTDVDAFPSKGSTFREELGIARETPLVGLVAHVYRPKYVLGQTRGLKGHEDFIDAVGLVLRRWPDARAVIVGGPWSGAKRYEARLRTRARRVGRDRILFTGHRTDIPSIYADLDVAVHPSLSENCGGAVESLAAGRPTVATAVGGLPDVVIDGETGWLVPPRNPERLAAAILEALENRDEARRRAAAGQALVRKLFDVRRTGREIASIYAQVLSRVSAGEERRSWATASGA